MRLLLAAAATAALSVGAAGDGQAATVTAVIEGATIYDFVDGIPGDGVPGFGTAGGAGIPVTLTYTFDPELAPYRFSSPGDGVDETSGGPAHGLPVDPSFLATVTINGVSKQVNGTYGSIFFSDVETAAGYDMWQAAAQDNLLDGDRQIYRTLTVYIYDYLQSLPFGLDQPFELTSAPDDFYGTGGFQFHDFDGATGEYNDFAIGSFQITSVRVTTVRDPAPVPLPASALLLLAGMGGLAALRLQRRGRPAGA